MLTSMMNVMAQNSRIVLCGILATYNNWTDKELGIKNVEKMITKRV